MKKSTRNYGKAYQEGGEVEELEQNPSGRRSIYGDMDVTAMAKRSIAADKAAYEAAGPAERAKLDEARRRTPGYKRGGVVRKKK